MIEQKPILAQGPVAGAAGLVTFFMVAGFIYLIGIYGFPTTESTARHGGSLLFVVAAIAGAFAAPVGAALVSRIRRRVSKPIVVEIKAEGDALRGGYRVRVGQEVLSPADVDGVAFFG